MSWEYFATSRVPLLSGGVNALRAGCVRLTELFLLKLQMFSFISMQGFSSPTPHPHLPGVSCAFCSCCEPPQATRRVVYSCDWAKGIQYVLCVKCPKRHWLKCNEIMLRKRSISQCMKDFLQLQQSPTYFWTVIQLCSCSGRYGHHSRKQLLLQLC